MQGSDDDVCLGAHKEKLTKQLWKKTSFIVCIFKLKGYIWRLYHQPNQLHNNGFCRLFNCQSNEPPDGSHEKTS